MTVNQLPSATDQYLEDAIYLIDTFFKESLEFNDRLWWLSNEWERHNCLNHYIDEEDFLAAENSLLVNAASLVRDLSKEAYRRGLL